MMPDACDFPIESFHVFPSISCSGGDFEYPGATQQQLLQEFHDAFVQVSAIIKNDNGGLPPFWLSMFRDWLRGSCFTVLIHF